jgi:hypothetical protein
MRRKARMTENNPTVTPIEAETIAMRSIATELGALDPEARTRAWLWAGQRFKLLPAPIIVPGHPAPTAQDPMQFARGGFTMGRPEPS